jgi:hypothetical protein
MRKIFLATAYLGLGLTIGPSLGVFSGIISWRAHSQLMVVGMVLWFVGATWGMRRAAPGTKEKRQ